MHLFLINSCIFYDNLFKLLFLTNIQSSFYQKLIVSILMQLETPLIEVDALGLASNTAHIVYSCCVHLASSYTELCVRSWAIG